MNSLDFVSRNENVSLYSKDNQIRIIADVDLNDSAFDRVKNMFSQNEVFKYIYETNTDVIKQLIVTGPGSKTSCILVRNISDPDDEELTVFCFDTSIKVNEEECSLCGDMCSHIVDILKEHGIEEEDVNIISFQRFDIHMVRNAVTFDLQYDQTKHPSFVGKMIGNYFARMFSNFSRSLLR